MSQHVSDLTDSHFLGIATIDLGFALLLGQFRSKCFNLIPKVHYFCFVYVSVDDPSWIVQESTRHQFARQVYKVNRTLFVNPH